MSNVGFMSEVLSWDFGDDLSGKEVKVYRETEKLLENKGTRIPSGYAYKEVTHRKNKRVEVDFEELE